MKPTFAEELGVDNQIEALLVSWQSDVGMQNSKNIREWDYWASMWLISTLAYISLTTGDI